MVFVRKVQKAARNSPDLERIEYSESLGDGKTVVEVVMNYQLGGQPVCNMRCRIPAFEVCTVIPEGSVELSRSLFSNEAIEVA
jgi:hypothetical protein